MNTLGLAVIAALVLGYGLLARRLSTTVISAGMFFLAGGFLIGPSGFDIVTLPETSSTIEVLAEITLALVLFGDASRIRVGVLRRQTTIPLRLLGIGLPLTIVAGTLAALVLLPELLLAEAVVLAIILAPTDAALGQAVVSDERLPSRIRQALNVESGLNDGICVPLLVIALAWADSESGSLSAAQSLQVAVEAIADGVAAGVLVGVLTAVLLGRAVRAGWSGGSWEQVVPFAAALASYGLADWAGGSGFIAAFVGGIVFGALFREHEEEGRFLEEAGGLTNAVTFIVVGAALLGPLVDALDPVVLLYAILSLTVVRMVPVALSLLGTNAKRPTVAFLGWFGPRGLASLVFVVLVLDSEGLPHADLIVTTALATVVLSVIAHGISAVPLVNRYAAWYHAHVTKPAMESVHTTGPRWRSQPFTTSRSSAP
ncbi:MAG: cation:proton antiporter [Actinomycetes bacterium]